jgi:hypothetical protein
MRTHTPDQKATYFLLTTIRLITSQKNLITSFSAPHMHTAHSPHCQIMISTSPYTSTFQPIYPPKNTHTSTQHTYSSPAATPLQYLLPNMHSLPAIKHPNSSFQITPLFNALTSPHCSNSSIHKPSFTNPQVYPTMIHPLPLSAPSTPSQLHPAAPTPLPTQPQSIRLYKLNPPHTQYTLYHHRYFTLDQHTPHHHKYLTLFMMSTHFSYSQSPLYTFSSFTCDITDTLSINIHLHPTLHPAMTSNIHLGDSSGGSNRRLRSTAARKKNSKLPLNLELLKLAQPHWPRSYQRLPHGL